MPHSASTASTVFQPREKESVVQSELDRLFSQGLLVMVAVALGVGIVLSRTIIPDLIVKIEGCLQCVALRASSSPYRPRDHTIRSNPWVTWRIKARSSGVTSSSVARYFLRIRSIISPRSAVGAKQCNLVAITGFGCRKRRL